MSPTAAPSEGIDTAAEDAEDPYAGSLELPVGACTRSQWAPSGQGNGLSLLLLPLLHLHLLLLLLLLILRLLIRRLVHLVLPLLLLRWDGTPPQVERNGNLC
jgi:hypothetical protein